MNWIVIICSITLLVCSSSTVVNGQIPTVTQSLASFDQNGGILTIYGTGFVQRNIDQFQFTLVTGSVACPATTPCQFFCHYRTMIVNAAGTITYCEIPYIADNTLGPAGSNYIQLKVVNSNGAMATPVTVATVVGVLSSITPSTSNVITPSPFGITVNGVGFPSENSLFTQVAATPVVYQLDLTDGTTNFPINLVSSRSTAGLTPNPLGFWNVNQPTVNSQICRWNKVQIDCYYINIGATPWVAGGALTAKLTISQKFSGGAYAGTEYIDTIGPVQIGTIVALASIVKPVIQAVATSAPFSPSAFISAADPILTIAGSGFLQYPLVNSNIFVPAQAGGKQAIRCDTFAVTSTKFQCSLTYRPATIYQTTAIGTGAGLTSPTPASAQIQGTLFTSSTTSSTPNVVVAIVNTPASANGFKYAINPATLLPDPTLPTIPFAIVPNDQGIQQDAETLTITSVGGSFQVFDIPYFYEYQKSSGLAAQPVNVVPVVNIAGLAANPATIIPCTAIFPDQVEPNPNALNLPPFPGPVGNAIAGPPAYPQSDPKLDDCTIIAMTKDAIVLNIPTGKIAAPVGRVITAQVNANVGGVADIAHATVPVGIITPGAGVGGDPHFFGFLGEKYEFDGEVGRVYNLLTDEQVQLNAEIGYWRFNRGKETIIRKLALKAGQHRVLIDAGGNHFSEAGFSMSVDGAAIPPSRVTQTFLGSEGWIRWNPLTPEDQFRLPLWERHQGVAVVDIVLNHYKFQVLVIEEGKGKDGVWHKQPSRFLDFMAEMLSTDRTPHGLFGQSAHLRANQRSIKDFAIEGEKTDYEVSNLFGDDFTFNKFKLDQ